MPPGFRASMDLAIKKCSEGSEFFAAKVELEIGEGRIADHRINFSRGQAGVLEILDADIGSGMERPRDAAGNAFHLDTDKPHVLRRQAHEIAWAAAWFQDRRMAGDAKASTWPRMHGGDDGAGDVDQKAR